MGWINVTLKVIPGVRHCFSTKRKKQRDTALDVFIGGLIVPMRNRNRSVFLDVYTANIK